MIYVFDNSPLSALFRNYYKNRFPSLWEQFDDVIEQGRVTSTREVLREIEDSAISTLRNWCVDNKDIFTTPDSNEGAFVSQIFSVPHFQQNIEQRKLYKGGRNADPFVIAKASTIKGTVVTLEEMKPNAAKIPNICAHFGIRCISLEEFMEEEEWMF